MAADPSVLAFPGSALEMCRRLERRFRCIGIQQIVLDETQAGALGSQRGQWVVVTAWGMEQAGAAEAMQLFVGDRDGGFCAPGSLRGAFGPDAVLGPVFGRADAFFPQSALFSERTLALAPETTPFKVPCAKEPISAAPPTTSPRPSGDKGKAGGEAGVPAAALASFPAQPSHREQMTKPAPPSAAMPPPRPLVPARPRLPPLVSLTVDKTPTGAPTPVKLSIVAHLPLVNLSFSAGVLRITASVAATGHPLAAVPSKPLQPSAQQQKNAGGARAPAVAGPPAVPLTGGNFQSARHTSAMASALRRADRAAQYTFHSGRVPWYVATA
jgi:hypothetical protein